MSEKNYDPRMHSAEHILNQTMVRLFNCGRSHNSHIESKKSKCDYRISRMLTEAEIQAIENGVNSIINNNLPVTEEYAAKEDASKFLDLTKLPPDAPDKIRVVRIGDYDACACIGPHVRSTSEIGVFRIISTDFINDNVRIRFKLEGK